MKLAPRFRSFSAAALLLFCAFASPAIPLLGRAADAAPVVLWQIGQPDRNDAEFALAPAAHREFRNDGFFVVGESDPKRDWPYAHPGPSDSWAGSRPHTFVVCFGLKTIPADGECQLKLDVVDTHRDGPPQLRISINGQNFERTLAAGAGDDSINGQPGKGRPQNWTLPFPSRLLHAGDNDIRLTTLGGSWLLYDALTLTTPAGAELGRVTAHTLVDRLDAVRALQTVGGRALQPVRVTLRHFGPEAKGTVKVAGAEPLTVPLRAGLQEITALVPAVSAPTPCAVSVDVDGQSAAVRTVTLKPVKPLTVYILPHSHTDIGYTEIQTDIEKKQVNNLLEGIAHARKTAAYPEGARFVWNVEVLWAADLYLNRLGDKERADFLAAVSQGQVSLCGMYLNELTGLCRPEELVRLFRYATQLGERTGRPIDAAMISDVPGYTWGTVTAMAQAGIKYFSTAPNYFDRIGTILREWENKPFYWVGPDGQSKVLVWIPFWGYAMSHKYGTMSAQLVDDFCDGLEQRGYPYDIAHVRWSGHGDNAVPDPAICEFVRDWNARYTWPHFVISGASEAFRALEQKYGDKLPRVRGDWTPYWEDGAGSSAEETALNRATSDRLAQAETLFALQRPAAYPAGAFEAAWRNVLLYSEHTWGAWCSVSEPERKETVEQWAIKQGYAREADRQTRALLAQALRPEASAAPDETGTAFEVVNTLSWPRTELVTARASGDRVLDDRGRPVPSQRLTNGDLAWLARDVPPFASRRFTVTTGAPHQEGTALAQGTTLDSGRLRAELDPRQGGIVSLTAKGIPGDFVDPASGGVLNEYLYLIGDQVADVQRNGNVTISVGEAGPLVGSLIVESPAPGCRQLRRELRIVAGADSLELINTVDKARLAVKSYMAKEGKESLNFGFPFHVPDGQVELDLPLGRMRPEADQMPSACKNWFTVGRWADVSNRRQGITWVTLDAPLVQVGGLTAILLNSQTNPDVWRKEVEPTRKLYSWAMNNHWGTNYRAYQDGPVVFRFWLRPHRAPDPAEASRFSIARSQPLLVRPATKTAAKSLPRLRVEPAGVLVTGFKPSDDGQGWIVRLFGASDRVQRARLSWADPAPRALWLSDTSEKPLTRVTGAITVPVNGLVTVRAER